MRLLPDGTIEFDATELESVLAARERIAKRANHAAPKATPAPQGADDDPIAGFMEHARQKPTQLTVLKLLKERGAVTMPEMIEALGVDDGLGVSGVMSGLRKNANKWEIELEDYVRSERDEEGVMVYAAGPRLDSLPLE